MPSYSLWEQGLLRCFVNNQYLASVWHCHQLPQRSFHVRGRQFHICARCTGLITGPLTAPLWFFIPNEMRLAAVLLLTASNALDGGTQLLNMRESKNFIRFTLGLTLSSSATAVLLTWLIGKIHG